MSSGKLKVYQVNKSVWFSWRVYAHKSSVNVLKVKVSNGQTRVYTGGSDGYMRVLAGGKGGTGGRCLLSVKHKNAVTALSVGHSIICTGDSAGNVIIISEGSGEVKATYHGHSKEITAVQVVNEGRVFSSSVDGKVILWGAEGEVIRQFTRSDLAPITCMQVVSANLLFAGTSKGTIDVWNMHGELLKSLTTKSIENRAITCLSVSVANGRALLYCGIDSRLFVWDLLVAETAVTVAKCTSFLGKGGRHRRFNRQGEITSLWPVFSDAYNSGQPVVYIGSTTNHVHLYLPTDRIVAVSVGQQARRFKNYFLRGASKSITSLAVAGGRVYAGSKDGSVISWKEPMNMLRLRNKAGKKVGRTSSRPSSVNLSSSSSSFSSSSSSFSSTSSVRSSSSASERRRTMGPRAESLASSSPRMRASTSALPTRGVFSWSDSPSPSSSSSSSTSLYPSLRGDGCSSSSTAGLERQRSATLSRSEASVPRSAHLSSSDLPYLNLASPRSGADELELDIGGIMSGPTMTVEEAFSLPSAPPIPEMTASYGTDGAYSTSNPYATQLGEASAPMMHEASSTPVATAPPMDDVEDDDSCIICCENTKDALLYPCGHLCLCFTCGKRLCATSKRLCPICRQRIQDVVRVFKQ